jgi:hypothetical protein
MEAARSLTEDQIDQFLVDAPGAGTLPSADSPSMSSDAISRLPLATRRSRIRLRSPRPRATSNGRDSSLAQQFPADRLWLKAKQSTKRGLYTWL